jgi:hypothetical protein
MTRHGQGRREGSGTHPICRRLSGLPAGCSQRWSSCGTSACVSRRTISSARPHAGRCVEGFDTPDLQEAKAFLEELGG